ADVSEEAQTTRAEGASALEGGLARLGGAGPNGGSSLLGRIGGALSGAASAVTGWISSALGDAASTLHGYGSEVLGAVAGLASATLARIKEIGSAVAGAVRSVVTRAVGLVQAVASTARSTLAWLLAAARSAVAGVLAQAVALVERVLGQVAQAISNAVAQAVGHVREARARAEPAALAGCGPEVLTGVQQRRQALRGELDAAFQDQVSRGMAPAEGLVPTAGAAVGAVVSGVTGGVASLAADALAAFSGARTDTAAELQDQAGAGRNDIAGARSAFSSGRTGLGTALGALRSAPTALVGRISQLALSSGGGDTAPGAARLELPPVTSAWHFPFTGGTPTPTPGPIRPPIPGPPLGPRTAPIVRAAERVAQKAAEQAPKLAGEAGAIGLIEAIVISIVLFIIFMILFALAVMMGLIEGHGIIELPAWRKPEPAPRPVPTPDPRPDKKERDDDDGDCRSCGPGTTAQYQPLDKLGRATGVRARLKGIPDPGTAANPKIEPSGWHKNVKGGATRARAHLLGKELGGSGDRIENLVTFDQGANVRMFNQWESRVFGESVKQWPDCLTYEVRPVYDGDAEIAHRIETTVTNDCTKHVLVKEGVDNLLLN
ncbi:MAG: DNA/RNA non-specific endonuclease, partial [Solirubrobacteraceae bacterium]